MIMIFLTNNVILLFEVQEESKNREQKPKDCKEKNPEK